MHSRPILQTDLPLPLFSRGKVRDTYDLGEQLLMVATDRISAYDSIMPNPIPYKGQVLTAFSVYWFDRTKHVIPNHLITANPVQFTFDWRSWPKAQRDQLLGRSMLVKKAQRIDIECVARGYLAGSAWVEYGKNNIVGGIQLPNWLHQSQQLVEPIFTPAIKAATGHDVNITFDEMANQVGRELAEKMRDATMRLYAVMSEQARQQGIIMADTKLEFGLINGELTLIDEIGTPDSSRYWEVAKYRLEGPQLSLDKQYLRDWLTAVKWNREPPPPSLPNDVVQKTSEKYLEAYKRIAKRDLQTEFNP